MHTLKGYPFLPEAKQTEAGQQTVSGGFGKYSHSMMLIYNKIW